MGDLVNEVVDEFHGWLRKKGADALKGKKGPALEPTKEAPPEAPPRK